MPRQYRSLVLMQGEKYLGPTPLNQQPPTLYEEKSRAMKFDSERDLVEWIHARGVETYKVFRRVWINR
jgi:hypothetical protein